MHRNIFELVSKTNKEFDLNSNKIKQFGIDCNELVSEKYQLKRETQAFSIEILKHLTEVKLI